MPDEEIDLADAALQLARSGAPQADWQAARAHLTLLARDAAELEADAGDLPAQAAALGRLLAGRYRYKGDDETYDDLVNANLIRVIERRRGLPVTLAILWLHAARAAGWQAYALDVPGHVLVALSHDDASLVVDPFTGGQVVPAAKKPAPRPAAMGNRDVLLRLQNNIRVRRAQAGELAGALACMEDMLRIAPDQGTTMRAAMAELRARLN